MYYLVYYTHYRLNVAATIAVAVFAIPFTVLFVTFLLLLVYPPRFYQQKSQFLVRVLVFNTSFYCQCLLFGLLFLQCLFLADTKCHTERFVLYFFFLFTFTHFCEFRYKQKIPHFLARYFNFSARKWTNLFFIAFRLKLCAFSGLYRNISAFDQSFCVCHSSKKKRIRWKGKVVNAAQNSK